MEVIQLKKHKAIKNKLNYLYLSTIIIIFLSILELLLIKVINSRLYANAINYGFYILYTLIQMIFLTIGIKKNSTKRNRIVVSINFFILALLPLIFYFIKPSYTYKDAMKKIQTESSINTTAANPKSIETVNRYNIFINKNYLISTEDKTSKKVYLFDPSKGSYKIYKDVYQ